jgi:alpha-tubulin suppressor-like RCC1 family protein
MPVQSVSAGTEHGCARMAGLGAYCWGNNAYGQLGNNDGSGSNAAGDPVRPHW